MYRQQRRRVRTRQESAQTSTGASCTGFEIICTEAASVPEGAAEGGATIARHFGGSEATSALQSSSAERRSMRSKMSSLFGDMSSRRPSTSLDTAAADVSLARLGERGEIRSGSIVSAGSAFSNARACGEGGGVRLTSSSLSIVRARVITLIFAASNRSGDMCPVERANLSAVRCCARIAAGERSRARRDVVLGDGAHPGPSRGSDSSVRTCSRGRAVGIASGQAAAALLLNCTF